MHLDTSFLAMVLGFLCGEGMLPGWALGLWLKFGGKDASKYKDIYGAESLGHHGGAVAIGAPFIRSSSIPLIIIL